MAASGRAPLPHKASHPRLQLETVSLAECSDGAKHVLYMATGRRWFGRSPALPPPLPVRTLAGVLAIARLRRLFLCCCSLLNSVHSRWLLVHERYLCRGFMLLPLLWTEVAEVLHLILLSLELTLCQCISFGQSNGLLLGLINPGLILEIGRMPGLLVQEIVAPGCAGVARIIFAGLCIFMVPPCPCHSTACRCRMSAFRQT
mmetsp:Transcript_587/g.1711  ORF Transcript_587/g.1711 Transcript_587/m.1711 type:complete len:202 (+) Transcript_587:360-965(+)